MAQGRPYYENLLRWETGSVEIEQAAMPAGVTELGFEFSGKGQIWGLLGFMNAPYTVSFFLEDLTPNRADLQFVVNGNMSAGRSEYEVTVQAAGLVANNPYKVTAVVVIAGGSPMVLTGFGEGIAFQA